MIDRLDDYDWRQAFGYVGEPGTEATGYQGADGKPMLAEGAECSADPFTREDVAHIEHISDGENDERDWLIIGRLNDGRWFYLEAGCDYTGWDCQADGSGWLSHSLEHLLQFGITDQARTRFGL